MPDDKTEYHISLFDDYWRKYQDVEAQVSKDLSERLHGRSNPRCSYASYGVRKLAEYVGQLAHHADHLPFDSDVANGILTREEADMEIERAKDQVATAKLALKNIRKKFISKCSKAI